MTKQQEKNVPAFESTTVQRPPDVLMLMGVRCAFCDAMMQTLTGLQKAGKISELRFINIEIKPELASELGVRSVPWVKIGPFELVGSRTEQELSLWLERAESEAGISAYIEEMLLEGNIESVTNLVQHHTPALNKLIDLIADLDAKINIRVGVGAVIEDIAATDGFKVVIPKLVDYLSHDDARIRGDACHYLLLTGDMSVLPEFKKLLTDDSEEVREIAQESLDEMQSSV